MGYFAPYVSVAKRRANARRKMDKLRKQGHVITPIELSGRKIATTFWGKGWCDHIESFSDYENRLPRGRRYVRNGSVCHLEMNKGEVKAIVSGSELYNVTIMISTLSKAKWSAIKTACAGQIGSLLDLLNGTLSDGVMAVVSEHTTGLFPLGKEIKLKCDCFDWADMCKHVAAVLYGVGARLDSDPKALFLLRGVDHEELIDISTNVIDETLGKGTQHRIADEDSLSELFGIDFGDTSKLESKKSNIASKKPKQKLTPKAENTTIAKSLVSTQYKKTIPVPRYYSGANLKKLRNELGLTQKEMARKLKMSASGVSKFENQGRKKVTLTIDAEKNVNRLWRKNKRKEK